MRHSPYWSVLSACTGNLSMAAVASAHEADQAGPSTHRELTTVVTKIQSALVFLKPISGLQNRAVSTKKAEQMGLLDPKVGDEVLVTVDEGNILLDIHKKGATPSGHRLVVGRLKYADPLWNVVELSTPEETNAYAVDTMAGSKLSVLKEGAQVRIELDEDNVVIDIHPKH